MDSGELWIFGNNLKYKNENVTINSNDNPNMSDSKKLHLRFLNK